MSVNYSLEAATATGWSFLRVLALWRGSVWKLIWRELLLWMILFALLNILYYFLIQNSSIDDTYRAFVSVVQRIPIDGTLMFLLTYMTYNSLTRWSETYKLLMWPENIAFLFKHKEEARNMKSSIVRYLTVFYILVFRDVSTEVRQWFPSLDHLVESKLLTEDELSLLTCSRLAESSCHYWIPIDWIVMIVKKRYRRRYIVDARGRRIRNPRDTIMSDVEYAAFIGELARVRGKVGDVLSYDWVPIPLAFVQTITVFVYSTLVLSTIRMQGRLINVKSSTAILTELFVESISTLPFNILYLSFLRISQVVINPFGQDDDDFETPYLIERHFRVLQEILCTDEPMFDEKIANADVSRRGNDVAEKEMLGHTIASALLQ